MFRQVRFAVEAFAEMLYCLVGELARTIDALLLLSDPASPAAPATPATTPASGGSDSLLGLD